MQIFVIRLKGPQLSSHNPVNGLRGHHSLNLTRDQKEESPNLQAWPVPGILMLQMSTANTARAMIGKEKLSWRPTMQATISEMKLASPQAAGGCFNTNRSTGETVKEGRLFHFT